SNRARRRQLAHRARKRLAEPNIRCEPPAAGRHLPRGGLVMVDQNAKNPETNIFSIVRGAGMTLALFATLGWAGTARAYEAGPVANGGSVSGPVKYKGTPPPRAKLDVNKDTDVCGATEKLASDLVVAPDGGIQYAVVSIPGIAKGKPFSDTKPVLDQKGCEY